MGDDIVEAQIADLSRAERDVLLEIYEALRMAPGNSRTFVPGGNMRILDHRGLSVTYFVLDEQREVAVLRVDRFPA
jgi:hypothetical protein